LRSREWPESAQLSHSITLERRSAICADLSHSAPGLPGIVRKGTTVFRLSKKSAEHRIDSVERGGIMNLAEGQRVAVDVADGQKGPEAVSLRLI
jgi:hypothetical protein